MQNTIYEYEGVVHIHSLYSDGSGTIEEIMQAATELDLDFAIITDHNTLKSKNDGYEGYYFKSSITSQPNKLETTLSKPTLCLISYEANDIYDQNHYLALGVKRTVHKRKPAPEYVEAVREAGGFGVIAHPHEQREAYDSYPPYPWTEWSASFDGIEIWNHMSEWMEGLKPENRFRRAFHPLATVSSPPKETLALWDKLNQSRKVIALGGVDAHAHKVKFLGFTLQFFPYKVSFRSIRNHLLLKEEINVANPIEIEGKKIYHALQEGNSFISNAYLGSARGFRFTAALKEHEYIMGDTIPYSRDTLYLKIHVPKQCTIRLIHNGTLYRSAESSSLEVTVAEKGIYRVECYMNGKAWIFSNAIRFI